MQNINIPLIFDIKRYSINDGPGIRITIFMKGCPLHCLWCHNPEGIRRENQKMYSSSKCIGCGICIETCKQSALTRGEKGIITDKSICVNCGECTQSCPSKAMEMSGKIYSDDMLMKEIIKETTFFDSSEGGGVTFCGGEPLMHPDYLYNMLKKCGEEDIHRTVDTTLYASWNVIEMISSETELFLVDLKVMDDDKHKKYTGVSNHIILDNIRRLSEHGSNFWIRIPLIDGINADEENLIKSADFLASLPNKPEFVNLLPYHDIAKGKHLRLGSKYNNEKIIMNEPSELIKETALEIFKSRGLEVKIGG